jgi:hypothetical protein
VQVTLAFLFCKFFVTCWRLDKIFFYFNMVLI